MYDFDVAPEVVATIAGLPDNGLPALSEIFDVLRIAPWNGPSYSEDNAEGAMRHWVFGPDNVGDVIYLILERARRVEVVRITCLGDRRLFRDRACHLAGTRRRGDCHGAWQRPYCYIRQRKAPPAT
ncbi:MAG: hypothetical protein ACT4QF_08145 [Sporichthyaceae bacterium]